MISLGILAADEVYRDERILQALGRDFEVHHFGDWRSYAPEQLLEKCRSVEVILTGRQSPRLPDELAEDFGRLRYLCHPHGSVRPVTNKILLEKGLIVTNWGDDIAGVAEGAMALLLCQLKQLFHLHTWATTGEDTRVVRSFPTTLRGRDVGLYGFGPIGRHMARMLEPFGPKIAIYDPYAAEVPPHIRRCGTLRELFATCQIISIHCGLNDQTRDSVTRELLELLPQGGIVVNTARGMIVDEAALAELVGRGRLLAGIDVQRDEANVPSSSLAKSPNAVLTRHRSSRDFSRGYQPPPQLADHVLYNLTAYRTGQPLKHIVTAEEYDLKT